jgi:hypothetical protein
LRQAGYHWRMQNTVNGRRYTAKTTRKVSSTRTFDLRTLTPKHNTETVAWQVNIRTKPTMIRPTEPGQVVMYLYVEVSSKPGFIAQGYLTTQRYRFPTVYLKWTRTCKSESFTFRKPQLPRAIESKRAIERVVKQKWRAIENCNAEKRHCKPSKRNRTTSHQGDPGYGPIDAYRRILRDYGITA